MLAEVEALVAEGVIEVTLLGQNVNSYGVEFGDRLAFGKLLRACGEIDGLERVRFTSPHPKDFTDDVIAAMAETPNVMPSLHMPLQSGSDRVLKAMRRSYRRERYLGIIDRVRAAMPDAAITTDIIVGFPGETEDDFAQTLEVVRAARFAGAFTFQYSTATRYAGRRRWTSQVPKAVVQERYERLLALQEDMSWAENKGSGRPDRRCARRRGRGAQGRRHPPALRPRAGQPAGALRDAGQRRGAAPARRRGHRRASPTRRPTTWWPTDRSRVRRTRAGDAWEARATGAPAASAVVLGMPTVGAPAAPPAVVAANAPACG